MAILKEIKGRIGSVQNTLKISSAMKLVASAKLHKAQSTIEGMLPYNSKMTDIMQRFLSSESEINSPYAAERPVKKVAIIAISSNTSLCGGFNSNIIRHTLQSIKEYAHLGEQNLSIYPIGRKVAQALSGDSGYELIEEYKLIGEKPTYGEAAKLAQRLMEMYVNGEVDRVELLYTHFKSMAVQEITRETFLPLTFAVNEEAEEKESNIDYIVEPSVPELITELIPQVLHMKMYSTLLDSNAAEHGARTVAMQQATDNGNELLQELNLMYNKGRQQAITSELLDIVGGSMK